MTISHTSAQAFRALVELPGHPFFVTPRARELLGEGGAQRAVTDIGALLLRADAFDRRWVSVSLWQYGGVRVQAVSRYWPEDGQDYHTEIALVDEHVGGYAVFIARSVLDKITPEERRAGSGDVYPPTTDEAAWIVYHGPYETVLLPNRVVLENE